MAGPPRILELLRADDPRDVIHEVVQRLVEGEVLGLPTETQYVFAAYSLAPATSRVAELSRERGFCDAVFAVKSGSEALDYLPGVSGIGRKLLRRFWPGPVTLRFDSSAVGGLAEVLPPQTVEALGLPRHLILRAPLHDVLQSILRLLPAPLVLTAEVPVPDALRCAADCAATAPPDLALVLDAGTLRYAQPTSVVRVAADSWHLEREHVVPARTLHRLAGNLFVFVCTGNTCRSPMAEALCRRLLSEKLGCRDDELVDRGYVIASAGVAAGPGQPASDESIEQMRRRGIDLRAHESQPVTSALVTQADRIFTMTRSHREVLVREFPDLADRVELLDREGGDIVDPIGGEDEDYRRCSDQIEQRLRSLIEQLPID